MRAVKGCVAVLLLLCACSHQQAFIITGQSIDTLGEQFVVVAEYMNTAVESGTVSEAQYAKWAVFGKKFQAAFPAAVQLFKIALLTEDAAMREKSIDMIALMIPELLQFAKDAGLVLEELNK